MWLNDWVQNTGKVTISKNIIKGYNIGFQAYEGAKNTRGKGVLINFMGSSDPNVSSPILVRHQAIELP